MRRPVLVLTAALLAVPAAVQAQHHATHAGGGMPPRSVSPPRSVPERPSGIGPRRLLDAPAPRPPGAVRTPEIVGAWRSAPLGGRWPATPPRRGLPFAHDGRLHGRRIPSFQSFRSPLVVVVRPYGSSYYYRDPGLYYGDPYLATPYASMPYAMVWPDATVDDQPEDAVPVESDGDLARAAAVDASGLSAELLRDRLLRVRWRGDDSTVRDVTLVVADSARRVLAAQTVREAPYTAVFDRGARVAYVGVTLVREDGVSATVLVPLGRVARSAIPAAR